jgi:predicted component of type VI protein secretion system
MRRFLRRQEENMASQITRLVMRTGPTPGKTYELNQSIITIGRDVTNNIVINDAEVSRRHARIVAQAGGYVLEDTGSTNGTAINGQRLMGPHLLRPGEIIVFGESVSLIFEATQYDPDATVAMPTGQPSYPPAQNYPPQPAYTPPPVYPQPTAYAPQPVDRYTPPPQPTETPSYSGQIPAGPAEIEEEEEPNNRRTWIILGCGCLVILLCILVAGGLVFDSLNLYCMAPFRSIFPCP